MVPVLRMKQVQKIMQVPSLVLDQTYTTLFGSEEAKQVNVLINMGGWENLLYHESLKVSLEYEGSIQSNDLINEESIEYHEKEISKERVNIQIEIQSLYESSTSCCLGRMLFKIPGRGEGMSSWMWSEWSLLSMRQVKKNKLEYATLANASARISYMIIGSCWL